MNLMDAALGSPALGCELMVSFEYIHIVAAISRAKRDK